MTNITHLDNQKHLFFNKNIISKIFVLIKEIILC